MHFLFLQEELPDLLNGPWGIIDKIGNPITLAAFIVAIVIAYYQFKIIQRRRLIEGLPKDQKYDAAAEYLGKIGIPIEDLTKEQRFELAMQTLKHKASYKRNQIFLAFFVSATLGFLAYTANEKVINKEIPMLEYTVRYKVPSSKDSIITRKIIDTKQHRNDHCSSPTNINWFIRSDYNEGWRIVTDSIKILDVSIRSNDVFNGIFEKTTEGFAIKGVVRNSGSCSPLTRDARGKLVVTYSYFEEKKSKVHVFDNIVLKGNSVLGSEIIVELPENALYYNLELIDSKNNRIVLSKDNPIKGSFSVQESEGKLIIKSKNEG
jgi:hypothetical protein